MERLVVEGGYYRHMYGKEVKILENHTLNPASKIGGYPKELLRSLILSTSLDLKV